MKIFSFVASPLFISILISFVFGCSGNNEKATLVLTNGNIITVDSVNSRAEAIAITSDSILAVGSNEDVESYIGNNTDVIDLNGKTAIPGFIESHAHFLGLGYAKINLDLTQADNWDEVIAIVAQAAEGLNPGEWIIGRGWHQEKWNPSPNPNVEGYPVHNMLSNAVPYNPVILTHASGHALFANARAMELAGITDSTENPDGGKIVRDEDGKAIGVFEEFAEDLIYGKYNEYLETLSPEELKARDIRAAKLASEEALRKGITTFHDAGETENEVKLFREMFDKNEIGVRLYVMLGAWTKNLLDSLEGYKLIGYHNNHLTVRSIKHYIDGALGSRGAWFLEEYEDLPGHFGQNVSSLKDIKKVAEAAVRHGYQLNVHAIGDKGVRETLNIYEKTFNEFPDSTDLRWRIEHAQHISNKDIPRFGKLGVIAAMQAVHCTSDAVFVPKRLGNYRAKENSYPWRKLIDSGAIICNGTDAPVEDVSPLASYYASVTRKLADGSTFYPGQKMTRMEALKSYTINGAYAAFEEDIKGSLEPGKLADITVLSNDILEVSADELLNTEVEMTIVGGKILYKK